MIQPGPESRAYLCVDEFMKDLVSARALATALEIGLVDRLAGGAAVPVRGLAEALGCAPAGMQLALDLLRTSGVLTTVPTDAVVATPAFLEALKYRDLLEVKLAFTEAVLCDFHQDFTRLLRDPGRFIASSRTYDLFRYDLCLNESPAALDRARRWMYFTTGLTRHEAGVLLDCYDVTPHRRMMDIGGNSGELSLALCRRNAALESLVFDIPAVCAVGREHVASDAAGARVTFRTGNALEDALPTDRDLITFKSMLHDWPDGAAMRLLERACAALSPGGTLLIYERGPFVFGAAPPRYSLIPCLLFLHCYRDAAWYLHALAKLGMADIESISVSLDGPFHVIAARKT